MKKVTIITIVYNGEKTIERTINSILAQEYNGIEYVLIDGNSTDNTLEIVEKYKEEFFKKNISFKCISEPDEGISDAFNKGLRNAEGDIICFLNADDWYQENTVKLAVQALEGKDFCYGNIIMHNGDTKRVLMGREISSFKAKYVMPIMHPTLFLRADVCKKVGEFNCKYKAAMDYDYVCRILKNGYAGMYVKDLFVNMQDGGVHKKTYFKTLKEVYRISVSYGGNKVIAFMAMLYTYLRNH